MPRIKSSQIANGLVIGAQGTDHNPLPTSYADSPNTSLTFSVPVASYIYVTYGAKFQLNTALHCYMVVNLGGVDQSEIAVGNATAGQLIYLSSSRVVRLALSAGSHTIKLRTRATSGSAAVAIEPYWYGTVVPQ